MDVFIIEFYIVIILNYDEIILNFYIYISTDTLKWTDLIPKTFLKLIYQWFKYIDTQY